VGDIVFARIPSKLCLMGCLGLALIGPANAVDDVVNDDAKALKNKDIAREEIVESLLAYNLARFIQWPAVSAERSPEQFSFCIFADQPSEAWQAIKGKKIDRRTLQIRHLDGPSPELQACDIVYFDRSSFRKISLKDLSEAGVITISSARNFILAGGSLELFVKEGNVSFDVNKRAFKRAGAKISSKVMRVGMRFDVASY